MLGATLLAHLPNGFFAPDGVEFTLSLFSTAIVLALAGPGQWSLDALIARRRAPALVESDRTPARKAA
jgi:putative oxidoreductase